MIRSPLIVRDQSLNFVVSKYGVGNRIMPVGCALGLAKELNYRLVMFWPQSHETGNARFDDLFDTTNLPFEIVEGYEARVANAVIRELSGSYKYPMKLFGIIPRGIYKIPLRFIGSQYDKSIETKVLWSNPVTDLRDSRKVLISTPRFFGRSCDVSWLKPSPHIAPRIAELKKRFTPNTIGVHVRGTDVGHRPAIEKIVSRMRAEVELDPEVKFFLASDGDESEKVILDTFGDKLIRTTPTIVSERRTVQGQQDSMVDLFGMASTSRLIGTWPSTFLVLAAMIGNKPLIRVRPKDFVYMLHGMI